MKKLFVLLGLFVSLQTLASTGAEATFDSLVCRSYDYYQLGGDRKVLEIAVTKESLGTYRVTVARAYEVLLGNRNYRELNRTTETDLQGMTCLQASADVDSKVVTCVSGSNYFNLARIDRTLILSASASTPGQLTKSTTYEAAVYGKSNNEYPGFDPKDCSLN